MMRMPNPFLQNQMRMDGDYKGWSIGMNYGQSRRPGDKYMPMKTKQKRTKLKKDQDADRRLPMIHHIRGNGSAYLNIPFSELEPKKREFIGWEDIEYLGENMVCI
jgi:hypothetical protein